MPTTPDHALFTVDAFTAVPFRGNPAAVCLLRRELTDLTMQAIAAEMKHSETAFLMPSDGSAARANRFSLRWFTPEVEVPLCGHATLAASIVIFGELGNPATEVRFDTMSGPLAARREGERIALDFPAADAFRPATAEASVVVEALGVRELLGAFHARGNRNLLLHVGSEREVRELAPDFDRLRRARRNEPFLGVIVTAAGSGPYDFVSRYFAPWVGVDEDPVTGSAHCALAPYWHRQTGRAEMRAYQASKRGGEMVVRLKGSRVDLVGEGVVVTVGELRLDRNAS